MKEGYHQRMTYANEALELNPSHPRSNSQCGMAICNEGRFAEAEKFSLRAIKLDSVQRKSYEGFFGFSLWQ
jgi:Flp pilus assembly protein TadD